MKKILKLSCFLALVGCDEEFENLDEAEFAGAPLDEELAAEPDALAGWAWVGPVSEELPPLTCPLGKVVTGGHCSGSYCDNWTAFCQDMGVNVTERYWMAWEPLGGYQSCESWGANGVVSGLACRGSYCGGIAVECSTIDGYVDSYNCDWAGPFSEEDPSYFAPEGTAITSILCSGTNCDNRSYRFCSVY